MSSSGRGPGFYSLALLNVVAFAILYLALWRDARNAWDGAASPFWWAKIVLEILASFYFLSAVLKSLDYLLGPPLPPPESKGVTSDSGFAPPPPAGETPVARRRGVHPPIACIYLCAGDLDRRALESLCRLEYPGRYHVYVHDDSGDPRIAEEVDDAVHDLFIRTGRPIFVLRRTRRRGGKPGAVNHVLARLGNRYPLVLLADNDSTAVDPNTLSRVLPLMEDLGVAIVQFRNVGIEAASEGRVNRLLRQAIEVFDLFAAHQARHGIPLFFGHNAMLRTSALESVGGLREGVFADDIDLSVRLIRRGWTIRYAPDIVFGETHPNSYQAFRRRAYKWAFGCGQILRRHLLPALFDRRLRSGCKAGLAEFVGFYAIQAVLIAYLILIGILLPLVSGVSPLDGPTLVLTGSAIVASIFLPSWSYYARHRRLREWWPFALICALVYGSVAFSSARGLFDGLLERDRPWIPTNSPLASSRYSPALVLQCLFGVLLFLVPAVCSPAVLWQPSMYLFASVFLFSPLVARFYVPEPPRIERRSGGGGNAMPGSRNSVRKGRPRFRPRLALRASGVSLALVLALPLMAGRGADDAARSGAPVTIRGREILLNGRPFQVRGVHYSPWQPGTGPMKAYSWPDRRIVDGDLSMIRALNANAIQVHDAPADIFEAARRHDLMVVYTFFINWQSVGDPRLFEERAREIESFAKEIATEDNLLAILLGNEVLKWVVEQHGEGLIEDRLRTLYDRVKAVAPGVPVSHANWPVTRSLDLGFLDLACFNLYPAWPREVVVMGYGEYIERVLKPLAGKRPLLITEFGQNTLEAGEEKQAQVLKDAWEQIRSRTSGGFVFSFADEWWKNYDNPISHDDWWKREYAPDDETTHDLDPEEYYGIVTSERVPKPAYAAVSRMYAPEDSYLMRVGIYSLPLLLIFTYTVYVLVGKRRHE